MAEVELRDVDKIYPGGVHAVCRANLKVADREFVVLVGPSGCGKSTLLRMIAGLETVTAGAIRIGGRVVNDLEPRQRDIAMVFQSYALYPHMNVFDNMALGLKLRKVPRPEIATRVREAAAILGIEDLLDRKPRALSGGQRQRVAVGRAIVRQPLVFLFDEPLSNLDAKMRVQTRGEIIELQRRLQATIVYVTHDQTEAMTMGHRIVVMEKGEIRQVGTPLEVYRRPANRFVAGFIGSPSMNLVRGRLEADGGLVLVAADGARIGFEAGHALQVTPGEEIELGVRPEHLSPGERPAGWKRAARCEGEVTFAEPLGSETLVHLRLGAEHTLVARVPQDHPAAPGARLTLWLDVARCHLFEPVTGEPHAASPAASSAE